SVLSSPPATRTAPVWTTSPTSRRYSPKFVGRFGFGGAGFAGGPAGVSAACCPANNPSSPGAGCGVAAAGVADAVSASGGAGGRVSSGCSISNHWAHLGGRPPKPREQFE